MRIALLALLLAGCAGTGGGSAPAPSPAEAKPGEATAKPGETPPELAAPAALGEGDRWFVALRPGDGSEPLAVRSRRRRAGGLLREEITWGRSFAEVATASHGTMQVFGVLLDGKGLSVALLDEGGKLSGEPRLEVASPYRVGNAWRVDPGNGTPVESRIEALEEVETPAGKVKALRVRVLGQRRALTTWYDAGLRPVRSRIATGSGEVIEASAALAGAEPTPDDCKAALEWAKKNLAR